MENLQNLSNEIDSIKNRIKDNEYKTIMELLGKINEEKKNDEKVKVIEITASVFAFVEWSDGESRVDTISNYGFTHKKECNNDDDECDCNCCNTDTSINHMEVSKPKFDFRPYTLNIEPRLDYRPSLDLDKGYIERPIYEELVKTKFIVYNDKVYMYVETIN